MPPASAPGSDDARWRTAGERIQTLLDASAADGPKARDRAEQLIREVIDLYGGALARITALTASDSGLADRLADDDLVASLLLVHGLHPHSVRQRIAHALDRVRPYLGSHGGDVHLLAVDGPTVRLQFAGNCKSCPSSAVTLELTIEDAIRNAAPEISEIEIITAPTESGPEVIPAQSLFAKVGSNGNGHTAWRPVPDLASLAPGEIGGFAVAGAAVLACRIGDEYFAYRDRCPSCAQTLAGAVLDGTVLNCPRCGTRFDVVHAGAGVGTPVQTHMEPVPVLVRDGVPSMAVA